MSRQLINEYRSELDRLRSVTGSSRETNLRPAFARLLRAWGKQALDLVFVEEHQIRTNMGTLISVDGALLHALRVPFGYWEAKDEDDKLDEEIAAKLRKGYPRDNIIFSDDHTAVLYQDGGEKLRVAMDDTNSLYPLLVQFFAHERQEITDFNKAIKQFAKDLPEILNALRDRITDKHDTSPGFATAVNAFLKHARNAINPAVSDKDVREMLIQHILTEDIFAKVFDDPDFHRKNNVAVELYKLEERLFDDRGEKQSLLKALSPYYAGIASTAALISSHSEKQGFLKALYENFYKVYNPLAADRLGVVYTPGEIVRFMIRSADWLCEKHFGKNLVDKGVEILDPATGTGTFIVELLEHFRGHRDKLAWKYKEELHANEVAILPYYVANLNIEATYAAITGQFAEYPNLCFVDTLDNVAALGIYSGHQGDMFGSVSDENLGRIKRQNERKISVIIGNPPYNANQQNENDNNKNRTYARVDERIKQTYIKASTAQKTKLYDMYARFYRWASDRLDKKDGIVAFITNRSFIESRTFDGFRKMVAQDFNEIWVVDLGGDVRANPKLSGTKHNVFGIQTGVAIAFMVRRKGVEGCTVRYVRRPEDETSEDKLSWLSGTEISALSLTTVKPNDRHDWLDTESDDGWDAMLPIASKQAKQASKGNQHALFSNFSFGLVTNRDDWVYDRSKSALIAKTKELVRVYEVELSRLAKISKQRRREELNGSEIKWTRSVKRNLTLGRTTKHDRSKIVRANYRPFDKQWLMFDRHWIEMTNLTEDFFGKGASQICQSVVFTDPTSQKPFMTLGIDVCCDMHLVGAAAGGVVLPRYSYTKSGERVDNITDWAVAQFKAHYGGAFPDKGAKDAIFAYCYAVLHDPLYRDKYALNLKREFPRIPFYGDFAQWVAWGEALLKLHIGYEQQKPCKLTRIDTPNARRVKGMHPKPKLKSDPAAGTAVVDEDTQLTGIPPEAWTYRLGNRSAIDWVLDQHKERTPRDPTIAAKFNTYRFADYKEAMIELLAKVVTVSLETMRITEAMRQSKRDSPA